jgi:hypothetical protein
MNKNRLKMGRFANFWRGARVDPQDDVADGETAAREAMRSADKAHAQPPRSIITISMEIFIVTVLVFFWL